MSQRNAAPKSFRLSNQEEHTRICFGISATKCLNILKPKRAIDGTHSLITVTTERHVFEITKHASARGLFVRLCPEHVF
jgi:hypothetical protein